MLFLFGLPLFPASLHVSRFIVLVVVVFVLIVPLSRLVFFSSPQAPPRALEQENNGLKHSLFCLLFGGLCEYVLSQNHSFFFPLG